MTNIVETAPFRVADWLPSDQKTLDRFISELIEEAQQKPDKELLPPVQELKDLIESDPQIYMLINKMFQQVPKRPPYNTTPTGKPQIRDYRTMLQVINIIITKPLTFNETGLVGFPLNAIIDWPMGTPAGTNVFLNKQVNEKFKAILNYWGCYLKSPDSASVLTDGTPEDWFSHPALEAIASIDPFRGEGDDPEDAMQNFIYNFKCDPEKEHWGFKSWDDFFTREFNEGRRPLPEDDDKNTIVNACESAPYRIAFGVQKFDTFWIKAQPYSIEFMLNNSEYVDDFVGGTVYQAFLSAKSYHRWHCPVDGVIKDAYVVDGSYYAEALSEGFDPAGPNDSQGYITEVATRALIFIESDNSDIGLMCFMPVGMSEVSSCDIFVKNGQRVRKGEQLGTFHFGGSTHCLLFRKGVKLAFDFHGLTPGLNCSTNIPINSRLATVCK